MNMKNKISIKTSFIAAALVGGILLSMGDKASAALSANDNASAAISLDYTLGFSNPVPSISYNQAAGTLVGAIPVSTITVIDPSQNSYNPYVLSGGILNFVTGQYNGQTGTFAPGGTITVSGGIPALSITASTLLLNGGFGAGASLTKTMGGEVFNFEASFPSTDSQLLYNSLGIAPGLSGSSNISLAFLAASGSIPNGPNNFINGYILDTPASINGGLTDPPLPTPIPAAAWLLGSGLVGLAGLRSRRKDGLAFA